MKPSEVTLACNSSSQLPACCDSKSNVMSELNPKSGLPCSDLVRTSYCKGDVTCNDVCSRIEILSVSDKCNHQNDSSEQSEVQVNDTELICQLASLNLDQKDDEPSFDKVVIKDSVITERICHAHKISASGNEYEDSEKHKEDPLLVCRGEPQEHEDTNTKDVVLTARGPGGGVPTSAAVITYPWPVLPEALSEYERQQLEPASKFLRPTNSNSSTYCQPFDYVSNGYSPAENYWSFPYRFGPNMQLTNSANLSGGSVAVQQEVSASDYADDIFSMLPPSNSQIQHDIIDELLAKPQFNDLDDVEANDLENMINDTREDVSQTHEDLSIVASPGDFSDAGYYSPSIHSSPGCNRASPDNLSNDDGDPPCKDELDFVLEYIEEDSKFTKDSTHHITSTSSQTFQPCYFGDPSNSIMSTKNHFSELMAQVVEYTNIGQQLTGTTAIQQQQWDPSMQQNIFHVTVVSKPTDTNPGTRKLRELRPKPAAQSANELTQFACSTGVPDFGFSIPPPCTSISVAGVSSEDDGNKVAKYCCCIAKFSADELKHRDHEGDTILHVGIARFGYLFVKALLPRLAREQLLLSIINAQNTQHQTPLYMAVYMNQVETVRCLIENGADVNVVIHRQTDSGPRFYGPIHCAAVKGYEWSEVLEVLLKHSEIVVNARNSEGRTALHCAIDAHESLNPYGKRIDSLRTIYLLAFYKADLGSRDYSSDRTPLHYAIEKKNPEFVDWFLRLVRHIYCQRHPTSADTCVRELVNARTSSKASALHIAWSLQIEPERRMRIIKTLVSYGAELSPKHDAQLRRDMSKIPELAAFLTPATRGRSGSRS